MKAVKDDSVKDNEQYFIERNELTDEQRSKVKTFVDAMHSDIEPLFKELHTRIVVGSSGDLSNIMLFIADKTGRVASVISTMEIAEQRAALDHAAELLNVVKQRKEN